MGCDIHTTVCVRDKQDSGMFKPVFGTIVGNCDYRSTIAPRYFRNYDIFGILTGETVRGGSILGDFEQEIAESFDSTAYSLPLKGRFPFEKIKWHSSSLDDKPVLDADVTLEDCNKLWDLYMHCEQESMYQLIRYCVPTNALGYYCEQGYHSHNYFTVKQLKKLIKRVYTLSTDSTLNTLTQTNLKNTADFLNEYKKDIMSIARLANVFYDDINGEDVLVLICFDN